MSIDDFSSDVPTLFTVFGITGDLAKTKLIPSLFKLYKAGMLPDRFEIIGFGRREWDTQAFVTFLKDTLAISESDEYFLSFSKHVSFVNGEFDTPEAYERLKKHLKSIDDRFGQCSNKLYHLAVPPHSYQSIFIRLYKSELSKPCGGELGWTRVLVEKPFGRDLKTAKTLTSLLKKYFKEEQIFLIDHYLAKETVQNILAFRIANPLFGAAWNNTTIKHVDIKLFEEKRVGSRGAFYDSVGALRDVGQNHLLQMMALVAMDIPKKMTAEGIRNERAKVIKNLISVSKASLSKEILRAQYSGYLAEPGVAPDSRTETYFKISAYLKDPQWKNVPFNLESGKALPHSKVEIAIHFKEDVLIFHIQPKVAITINEKEFSFDHPVAEAVVDAYERILLDCVRGDHTLFVSTEEVEAAWKFITPLLEKWQNLPLMLYTPGTFPVL